MAILWFVVSTAMLLMQRSMQFRSSWPISRLSISFRFMSVMHIVPSLPLVKTKAEASSESYTTVIASRGPEWILVD